MLITFSSLLTDTRNFITNRWLTIVLALLALAFISQIMALLLTPDNSIYLLVQQLADAAGQKGYNELSPAALQRIIEAMPVAEQQRIVGVVASYLFKLALLYVVVNLISSSFSLSLIANLSLTPQLTLAGLVQQFLRFIPQILLFFLLSIPYFIAIFFVSAIIQSLMLFVVLIGCFFYLVIYMIYLALLIEPQQSRNILGKVRSAITLFKQQLRVVIPMIALWFLVGMGLNSLLFKMANDHLLINVAITLINLLINFATMIYFYRLITLVKRNKQDSLV